MTNEQNPLFSTADFCNNFSEVSLFNNEMLEFASVQAFNTTLETLISLDSAYQASPASDVTHNDTTSIVALDPILYDFELCKEFNSLRKHVWDLKVIAYSNNQSTEGINQFFISDDYFNSLVNSEYEVKIGGSIFKFIKKDVEEKTLWTLAEITDGSLSTLDSLRMFSNPLIYENVTVHELQSNKKTTCDATFSFKQDPNTNTLYSFKPERTSIINAPFTYFWDFGDGFTSTDENPSFQFAGSGNKEVCLTVTDALGCTDTKCMIVKVGNCNGILTELKWDNLNHEFKILHDKPVPVSGYTYIIDFGDGTVLNHTTRFTPSFGHKYAPGTYTLCVTVDFGNCVDNKCTTIVV